jgi:hypothetical protein
MRDGASRTVPGGTGKYAYAYRSVHTMAQTMGEVPMMEDPARPAPEEQSTQHVDSPTGTAPQPTHEPKTAVAPPVDEPTTAASPYAENPTVVASQTPYQQPSEPFPVPAPQVVEVGPGAYPPAPSKPKAGVNRVLVVLVAVFFVAAGVFGALWFVERGDHKTTQGQLTSTRGEADDTRAQLKEAQKRANDADGLNFDLSVKRARLQQDLDDANRKLEDLAKEPTPCANAGRAFSKAVRGNEDKAEDAGVQVILKCK